MFQFCDICFRRPDTVGTLLISSCRHVVCRRCSKSSTICSVCEQPCRITEFCREKFLESMKDYFSPGMERLWKAFKISKFQAERQDLYISARLDQLEKYETKKQKILKIKEYYDSFTKYIDDEMSAIRKLRARRKSTNALKLLPPGTLFLPQMDSLRISTSKKEVPLSESAQRLKRTRSSSTDTSTQSSMKKSTPPSRTRHSSSLRKATENKPKGTPISQSSSTKNISPFSFEPASVYRTATNTEIYQKSNDLVCTARDGIYQEAVRNINNATKKRMEPVPRFAYRGSDIERARNVIF